MDKNVLIHVRGLQMMEVGEEQEPIELVVPGQYYFRNGSIISDMRKFWMKAQSLR